MFCEKRMSFCKVFCLNGYLRKLKKNFELLSGRLKIVCLNTLTLIVTEAVMEAIILMEWCTTIKSHLGNTTNLNLTTSSENQIDYIQTYISLTIIPCNFSDLFVERHDNVTVLYADIVNFTPLTVKMKADELVETLNELFGRFDDAAAVNTIRKSTRILL